MAFDGFPADTVRFLAELAKNNNRQWFLAHKPRYEQSVRAPALALIEAMALPLERISKYVFADPTPSGGSLMRVYRDTRFTGGKEPYKTNLGIQFRHERGRDIHAPGLYFHLEPREFFLACGMWRPEAEALLAIRTRIAERPDEWRQATKNRAFVRVWKAVTGDKLKRPPRGFDPDHPCIEDIKFTDFLGVADLPRGLISSPGLVDHVAKAFAAGTPLMKFLCAALGLPY